MASHDLVSDCSCIHTLYIQWFTGSCLSYVFLLTCWLADSSKKGLAISVLTLSGSLATDNDLDSSSS